MGRWPLGYLSIMHLSATTDETPTQSSSWLSVTSLLRSEQYCEDELTGEVSAVSHLEHIKGDFQTAHLQTVCLAGRHI